jgi:hypothetical protein
MDDPDLEGAAETVGQPKIEDATPEESAKPSIESVEQLSVEPLKSVEARDQDQGPEQATDDSESVREPQSEEAPEDPTNKVETLASSQAEGQGVYSFHVFNIPIADAICPVCKVNGAVPPDENTAEDSAPAATVERPVQEPIQVIDQDGKAEGHPKLASKGTAVQEDVGGGPDREERIVNTLSEVTPAGTWAVNEYWSYY